MRKKIIYLIAFIVIILIIFFTWQIIDWSKENILLSIDYKNKFDEIQAYSGIVGFLLSFLSILFVIYTIVEQREYFQKNIDLKESEEQKLKKDFIEFSKFYLEDVIKNTQEFGKNMKEYYEKAKNEPLKNFTLIFSVTNNNKRFSELDNLQLFKSFTENYSNGSKIYNDFLKYTDFYIEAKNELKKIYQTHSTEKFERKKELAYLLNDIIDLCSSAIEKYVKDFPNSYNQKPWYNLLNNFIGVYYGYIKPNEETDLNKLDTEVLLPFLHESQDIRNLIGFENNIHEIIIKLAKIRKMLYTLTTDCSSHAIEFENVYIKYFSDDSDLFKKIKDLATLLK
ncbi:hypothetical protein OK344_09160 [Kaistella sp. BT6-1-3]|uniref:Phage abortive infection protein n=1 Tax=Kaistella yananensis TaxID=2989820 RepID=A0ABT3JNL5_9FLAO|nr:hypothetical protein [Kaistella yananensis]MCW4452378.1 hypothetical protein [Kaistella yananensis]